MGLGSPPWVEEGVVVGASVAVGRRGSVGSAVAVGGFGSVGSGVSVRGGVGVSIGRERVDVGVAIL